MFMLKKRNKRKNATVPTDSASDPNGHESLPQPVVTAALGRLDIAGRSDRGKRREVNQDQFLIADLHKNMHVASSSVPFDQPELFGDTMGKLLLVADGMGGAQAGEVASQIAINAMAQHLLNSMHWIMHPAGPEIEQFVKDLKVGAEFTHQIVRKDATSDPDHRGMGTTLTVAYLIWPMVYVLHVGDSRCYILRDQKLTRMTKDQTLAQHLFDAGQLSDKDLKESPYNHVLISAIGGEAQPHAVVYRTRLKPGDRMLLCSDGVNAHLDDKDIQTELSSAGTADEICQRLIDLANQRGGTDNITAVVGIAGVNVETEPHPD